jgi:FkbM family methyltransferase
MGIQKAMAWHARRLDYCRTMHIGAAAIRIPSIRGITCGATEPWMIDVLRGILRVQPGAFLDVGVNVGQSLVKLKALAPDREYIGLEPNPMCVFYVQELIRENRFRDCTLLPVGLFTEDRVLPMNMFSGDPTDSSASIIADFRPKQRTHSQTYVPVFRFASLEMVVGGRTIGIIKIDVEGAEFEVVRSLREVIKRDHPVILIEVLPVYSSENTLRQARQRNLEKMFSEFGYGILRIEKTADNAYSGLRRIEAIGIHSDLSRCDYVVGPAQILTRLTSCTPSSG